VANRTLTQWENHLSETRVATADPEQLQADIEKAVEDLREVKAQIRLWKISGKHWEERAYDHQKALESEKAERAAFQQRVQDRLERYESIIDMMCGREEAMRHKLLETMYNEILATTPEKVEDMARATYGEFMKDYGQARNGWDKESEGRKRDLRRTIEVIMQVVARRLPQP